MKQKRKLKEVAEINPGKHTEVYAERSATLYKT